MYITKVIESAKALYPAEYSVGEYIDWCDELSADIALNYLKNIVKMEYNKVSEILLPEGVGIRNICKVIVDGRDGEKITTEEFGFDYEYEEKGRRIKKHDGGAFDAVVYYIKPHIPIEYTVGKEHNIIDKTLADAPYDSMYIDFVCMKAAMYQGDTNAYKKFSQIFKDKLDEFHMYVNRTGPAKNTRIYNWW